jgi:hypothetical protein
LILNEKIILILFLVSVCAVGASASTYESIADFYLKEQSSNCLNGTGTNYTLDDSTTCNYDAVMKINGTSNWLENAAFYYSDDNGQNWNFLTKFVGGDCKSQVQLVQQGGSYVGSYSCSFLTPVADSYIFRASIKYNGCGGDQWTPTPAAACGDTSDINVLVS